MTALVTVADVQARLLHQMDSDEQRVCAAAIEDLSNQARTYGSWDWGTPQLTPPMVRSLIAATAAEYIKNYDGFLSSTAGEERVTWADRLATKGAEFLPHQIATLKRLASGTSGGIFTSGMYAWSNKKATLPSNGNVPPNYGGKPIPWGE